MDYEAFGICCGLAVVSYSAIVGFVTLLSVSSLYVYPYPLAWTFPEFIKALFQNLFLELWVIYPPNVAIFYYLFT